MGNVTFKISERNCEEIDRLLLDKYHNYSTKFLETDQNVEYIESLDKEGKLLNLFVLKVNRGGLIVDNKFYLHVDPEEWNQFLLYCISHYQVTEIKIGVLLDRLPRTSLPCIEYSDNVDNIATLPTSFTNYISQLGKQTKKHAKYYLGRVARDLPQMQFSISEAEDIRKEDYDSITELSKERMESKYTKYGLSVEEDYHRFLELKRNGLILTASIDGKICAGCVGFLMGDDFYLSKIAHDNDYSKYNLGQVALLKLIEYLIGRKVSRFHFLWCKGVDYKVRFGGVAHPIYNATYFKSKNAMYFKTKLSLAVARCKENLKDIVRRNQKIIKLYHKLRYDTK